MAHEIVPLTAEDTKDGPFVGSIYLAAFYFCFTTMTTVGYGDIHPYSNTERIVCIFIEVTPTFFVVCVWWGIIRSLTKKKEK